MIMNVYKLITLHSETFVAYIGITQTADVQVSYDFSILDTFLSTGSQ
jgi:hypothetical protein